MAPGFGQQSAQVPAKRAVGLTSGAFDFAFATPSKSDNKGKGKEVARDVKPMVPIGVGMVSFQTPAREGENQRSGSSRKESREEGRTTATSRETITPIREISASTRTSGPPSLSVSAAQAKNMMGGNVKKEEPDKSMKTPRKLTTLSSITTPWAMSSTSRPERPTTPDSSSSSKRRRLGDLEVHLPTGQKGKEEKEDLGRRVALRHMGEGVRLEGVGQIEEVGKDEGEKEVGIGISPRKARVKWTGRGEIPLANRLNSLLTTQTSSLTLFYTSLQHTLHPSHPSRSLSSTTKTKVEISAGPTPLEHIRTAPMRLLLIRPLTTREHVAQLWLASVRTWPTQATRGYINGVDGDPSPKKVIVNFSQAAKGAAAAGGAGSDIKVLAGRWWDKIERGRRNDEDIEKWEVGVWSEWSMADIPMMDRTGEVESQEKKERRVVFVSRYLIAERR